MQTIWRRALKSWQPRHLKKILRSVKVASLTEIPRHNRQRRVHKTWRCQSFRILHLQSPVAVRRAENFFPFIKLSTRHSSHFSSVSSSNCMKMVAEAEIVVSKNPPAVLEVQRFGKVNDHSRRCRLVGDLDSPNLTGVQASELVSADLPASQLMVRFICAVFCIPVSVVSGSFFQDRKSAEQVPALEPSDLHYSPIISSGSYADIGPRRFMEDEHVRMDDLSSDAIGLIKFPKPSAFYAVFDGHGGAEASNFVSKNVKRLFFEDVDFPNSMEVDEGLVAEVENSLRCSFRLADQALAEESSVSTSCGTTALAALVLGSVLIVANVGDCRAVLCRGGEAVDMSKDHRPTHPSERRRVVEMGSFVDDGYLNGILSVTRALGDWDLKKFPHNSPSPLISEPEIMHSILTEEDEFLIMGCDGIWDVMSSQQAVSLVRRGLRRHGDLDQCARDLVREALRRNTFDNLTVIVVCFYAIDRDEIYPPRQQKLRCCNLSAEAFHSLKSWLDSSSSD